MSVTVTEPEGDPVPGPAAPVLELPLRLDGTALATLPQGSAAELGQSVRLLMSTRPGERLEDTPYGTRDYAFATDVDAAEIEGAVREHEPRVDVDVTVGRDPNGDARITVRVTRDEDGV